MNEALARRVFLGVVVVCIIAFGLVDGLAVIGSDLETVSSADSGSAAGQAQASPAGKLDPNVSAQQQLAAADSDITSSSTDLAQVSVDMGAPKDK